MRYSSYPKYESSSVDWLGELPQGWSEKRLKFLGDTILGLTYSPEEITDELNGTLVLRANNIQDRRLVANDPVYVRADAPEKLKLRVGDILICSRNGSRHLIGKCGRVTAEFVGSYFGAFNTVFRTQASDYLFYVLNSSLFEFQSGSYLTSTINQLTVAALNSFVVPVPSPEEQKKIAAFLDWKTGQIDALIAKKQALIEKLKEKRLAVITQAVTKGLDLSVPLQDSGIPWLGKVPKHWQLKRLKWAIMFQRGHDLPADERNHGEIPLVSSSGISALHDVAIAKGPGIVTGRYGTIGVFHLVEEDYWPLNTTLYSIDMYDNSPRFLCALLENLSPLFLLNAKKSAVPGVDRNDLHTIPVVLPETEEQNEIADYLEIEERKYLAMRAKVESAIARLTEYRTALISAATTGKIDVRQIKIPAEA